MAQWYYGENGKQMGPVSDAEFNALIANGNINDETLVWREGMPNWQKKGSLTEINAEIVSNNYTLPQPSEYIPVHQISAKNSTLAIVSLVTGILGLVLFCCHGYLLFSPIAVITGHLALNQIKNHPHSGIRGRELAISGLILGYIMLVVFVLFAIAMFIGYSEAKAFKI